jgi:type IV pilus assembly protein PilF
MSARTLRSFLLLVLIAVTQPALAQESGPMTREKREQAARINAELAITYMKQGNLQAARDKIDRALKQNPRTADTQMAAGFVYDRLGQDKKAAGHFDQAVKLAEDNPDVLNNAAVYMCRKGDKKRGEAYFLQAAASPLYKTPEVAYLNAGQCARADGRPKEAEQYFRQALVIKPDMQEPLLQLADVLHHSGSNLQARAFLQRYTAVASPTASVLWLGYRIETALGDSSAAQEYGRRLKADFAVSTEAGLLLDAEKAKP